MRFGNICSFFIIFWLLLLTGACKYKSRIPAIDVIGYIKADMQVLDSMPYDLLKITEKGNRQADSVYINKSEVWQLLTPFLSDEIRQDNLTEHYTESSYADATIHSVTITYQAKKMDAVIHHVELYVNPLSGKISGLHITALFNDEKWTGKKQLWWIEQKGFSIISTPLDNNPDSETTVEKISWQ